MSDRLFNDRREAGRFLAGLLDKNRGQNDVTVLALPRGGVPVGFEVPLALGAPLDVLLVRKLGVPGHEELAIGAIASVGVVMLNDDVVRGISILPKAIERVVEEEGRELHRREHAYREGRAAPDLTDKAVISWMTARPPDRARGPPLRVAQASADRPPGEWRGPRDVPPYRVRTATRRTDHGSEAE
jgi:hypothetical protein